MNRFQADTLAIEALFAGSIVKEAQLGSTFSTLANSIYQEAAALIDTSTTESTIKSVLKVLEPGVFFVVGTPMLGILNAAIQTTLGWSVTDALFWIVNKIKPMILSGQPVPASAIDEAAASFAQSHSGTEVVASNDTLFSLRVMHKNGSLKKYAAPSKIPGADALAKLVAAISGGGAKKGSMIGSGVVGWIIKVILIGGGLLVGGGLLKRWITGKPSRTPATETPTETAAETITETSAGSLPQAATQDAAALKSSGEGEVSHPNTSTNVWFVPLVEKNIASTLLAWIDEIYPQFSEYDRIIVSMPSFKRAYNEFAQYQNYEEPDWITVPEKYKRRIDVVKPIVTETYQHLKSQI